MAGTRRVMLRGVLAVLSLSLSVTSVALAQAILDAGVTPEVRVDAITSRSTTVLQLGGGVQIPVGYYARIGVIGAFGAPVSSGARSVGGRLDLIARFLFDPFREHAWGLSAGAGISVRAAARDRLRPYLATVIDLEGRRSDGGISPAFQLGLGGGVRIGAALRWGGRVTR